MTANSGEANVSAAIVKAFTPAETRSPKWRSAGFLVAEMGKLLKSVLR
jgi:hypothetical protein